jgi:hypothetical protein
MGKIITRAIVAWNLLFQSEEEAFEKFARGETDEFVSAGRVTVRHLPSLHN